MPQALSNHEIYQQLRLAIDDVDIDKINQVFNDHPDLDWNTITPNRLSALWWALIPPNGKPINHALISFLLSLKRSTDPVINPTQLYTGFRPAEYLINHPNEESQQIREEILTAENIYSATQERIAPAHNLHADTHSASNPFIVRASDVNLKRLYQRYKTRLVVENELKDIDAFIKSPDFQKSFPLKFQQDLICETFQEIKTDITSRSNMTAEVGPCTLKEALALIWLAAKETQTNLVTDPNPLERQKAIFEAFFIIQNDAACWPGRWGWLGTVLSGMHQDVYYGSDIKLTGDIARDKFTALLGDTIADTYVNNRAIYWSILRTRLEVSDEKTETIANTWLQEKIPILKEKMLQANIDPKEIPNFLDNITVDIIPLSRHEPSRQLEVLQKLFYQHNAANLITLKHDNENVYEILENFKTIFLNNCLELPNDISKLNLETSEVNQFKQWILNNLLARNHKDEAIKIADLWLIVKTQIKITDLKNDVLSNWYKKLDLGKQIAIARDCLSINTLSEKDLVTFALKHFCITGLSFKGMDLSGMDFRCCDLSGINFSNADLTGVDLSGMDAKDTIWKGCNLNEAKFNPFIFPEALLDSNQCTEEALKKQDTNGNTLLHWLIIQEKIPLIKAVLASPHCSSAVLKINNDTPSKATPLNMLIEKTALRERTSNSQERRQLVELFLASPHCTEEVLSIGNKRNASILHRTIYHGHFSLAQTIINSKNCTEKIFSMVSTENQTILHSLLHGLHFTMPSFSNEIGFDIKAFALRLINSPKLAEKVFSSADKISTDGKTPLQFAILINSPYAKAIEAAQTRCFLKNLKEFLNKEDTTKEQILERFNELKKKDGDYAYIHVQLNSKWDKFRMFFKRAANGEKNFWHTEAYQTGVKMLKNAYLKKGGDVKDKAKEKAFIDYYRGNSIAHPLPTSTRRRFK